MPARGFKGGENVGKNECVERIEVHENGVANVAFKKIKSKLPIEGSALDEVGDEVVAIGTDWSLGLAGKAIYVALADIPIGSVNRDMANAASVRRGSRVP